MTSGLERLASTHPPRKTSPINADKQSPTVSFSATVRTSSGFRTLPLPASYNLASDDGGGFLTGYGRPDQHRPELGPLQDNGGPAFTHALLPGSPAIDKGKNLIGSATDQRGFPRTVDIPHIPNAVGSDGTDIGAADGVGAGHYGFNLTAESNQPVVVQASTNLVNWTPLATNTVGASLLHFSHPGSTNYQRRFHRAKLAS